MSAQDGTKLKFAQLYVDLDLKNEAQDNKMGQKFKTGGSKFQSRRTDLDPTLSPSLILFNYPLLSVASFKVRESKKRTNDNDYCYAEFEII